MPGIVLQPIDQQAKLALAQQLACWAKTATGTTDPAVQYGTCCVSPTGETLGRWIIPPDLCDVYGPFPFTAHEGNTIACDAELTGFVNHYIYPSDVAAIDPNTCVSGEPLAGVANLAAGTPTDTTIPLSWDAVLNADGYIVSYSDDGGTTWNEETSAATSTTLTGLTANTEYTIRVRATDSTGTYTPSEWSDTITATTTA